VLTKISGARGLPEIMILPLKQSNGTYVRVDQMQSLDEPQIRDLQTRGSQRNIHYFQQDWSDHFARLIQYFRVSPRSLSIQFRPLIDRGFTLARQMRQSGSGTTDWDPNKYVLHNYFTWNLYQFAEHGDLAAVLLSSESLGMFALVVGILAMPSRIPAFWIESSVLTAEQSFEQFVQLARNKHADKIGPDRVTRRLADGRSILVALKKRFDPDFPLYEVYTTVNPIGSPKGADQIAN